MDSNATQPSFLATRRGKLTLALLCGAAFLDTVDTTIVNIALPSIRQHLGFSVQNLQWVVSAYLLTYGGFLLLGGRSADLLGRRRMLIAGTSLFGIASLTGGLAQSAGMLVGARLAQGVGAALMTPAALSIVTTRFPEGRDRVKAIGIWSATPPLASALGLMLGGVLSQGPGWRWIFFVNVPLSAGVVVGALRLLPAGRGARARSFDGVGAAVSTASMLILVYALVKAPTVGWGAPSTIIELAVAVGLLVLFLVRESRHSDPLFPLAVLRIKGLAAADATQALAIAGIYGQFFFLTLYLQNVLGFSPVRAGLANLPASVGVFLAAGFSAKLLPKVGARPVILAGTALAGLGCYLLAQVPVDGSYLSDVLPGLFITGVGLGAIFVGVQTAANAGVPEDQAGLAAALISTSFQLGAALGLAVFTAIATTRTQGLMIHHVGTADALTAGFRRAFLACCLFLVVATGFASRTNNTKGAASAELVLDAA